MDRDEAISRLWTILDELDELGAEAEALISEHLPEELPRAEAYGVFTFGKSSNRYDITLESILNEAGASPEDGLDD